ncbi:bifunctional protein FolD 2 [Neltuma alba]|uniref:bifunctional protein FolD 2 n=1 Tax=Neltuma alba TaxID=207710 RepID=UPI0010A55FDB|nr:bifunctional protein FolD 2 [Prosopis alba]
MGMKTECALLSQFVFWTGRASRATQGVQTKMTISSTKRDIGAGSRGYDITIHAFYFFAVTDFTAWHPAWTISRSVSSTSVDHMVATVIDGKAVSQAIRSEISGEVRLLSQKYGQVPGLAVVIVGNRKDSQSYVGMKRKACAEVGIKSFDVDLPEQVSEADLVKQVHMLNANPDVHGILVQLPLPRHINEEKVLTEISLEKDVDGFHPLNIGKLAMKGREPLFVPCTPKGCLELLHRSGVSIKGKKAVVVGRSNIVGLPVSMLLLKADATVTIVHSHTSEPERIIREADIIIAAAGQPMMVKGSWIKPGAAVIDVGTNAVDDPTKKSGYRLVGDVDFEEASKVAGWITPVPGGVGPMTVTMLLQNTLEGAKRKFALSN